jgi:hypothetical protein
MSLSLPYRNNNRWWDDFREHQSRGASTRRWAPSPAAAIDGSAVNTIARSATLESVRILIGKTKQP